MNRPLEQSPPSPPFFAHHVAPGGIKLEGEQNMIKYYIFNDTSHYMITIMVGKMVGKMVGPSGYRLKIESELANMRIDPLKVERCEGDTT